MTTRNFDALFAPKSIVLVGASDDAGSVGAVLTRNLLSGGFAGPIFLVNPHHAQVQGHKTCARIGDIPQAADLAVIATPAASVPAVIKDLAEKGCRAAVVISGGLSDPGVRQTLLDAARPSLLRIVGPNCLGLLSPATGVNASFAHVAPKAGGVALVAQSGAVTTAALDWAAGRDIGFSHVITLGDMIDGDFGDMLDYLALDPATSAILLYAESITQARKFMSAGRIATRTKPVVILKAGRSASGAKAAWSHTGALAGSDLVYDAAFRRAGMLRVDSLREMFDAVATLTAGVTVASDRLAIITNGGGAGVMAVDALDRQHGRLPSLSAKTVSALDQVLPPSWSHANPVDIIGDASAERYEDALTALAKDEGHDAILALNCPTALADSADAARAIIRRKPGAGRPLLSCWLGDPAARESRRLFADAGIPTYETPEEAVTAFMHLAERTRNHRLLDEVPQAELGGLDRAKVSAILEKAMADGHASLTEPDAKAVLQAYGVPVLESRFAKTAVATLAVAEAWTGPFALKILSPDIAHKSDVGGVALQLASPSAVRAAAEAIMDRVLEQLPHARIEGFAVQQMAARPMARELIVGLSRDPVFGPVVMFGHGGVSVEVTRDRVMGLPPLNRPLALDMIGRTDVAKLLGAWRDHPAAKLEDVADVICRLGQLAIDFPQIAELDINPLLADANGVLAMDARIALADPSLQQAPAIKAYPDGLSSHLALANGQDLSIRPIRPLDAKGLQALVARSNLRDIHFRFGAAMRELPGPWAARLAQIDYDREMALVGLLGDDLAGVARLAADPEGFAAEISLMVRSDLQDPGIGRALYSALIKYARDRGLKHLWGDVAWDNSGMLAMAEAFGFGRESAPDVHEVRIALSL